MQHVRFAVETMRNVAYDFDIRFSQLLRNYCRVLKRRRLSKPQRPQLLCRELKRRGVAKAQRPTILLRPIFPVRKRER